MSKISLVTGANGHLGNNLVRELVKRGEKVRASVRNLNEAKVLEGLDCEIVQMDLLDKESVERALKDVDTLYHCAAVYKHWAVDPEKEIIEPNLVGSRNILYSAENNNVNKIVYVGSIANLSLDKLNDKGKIDETTWLENAYGNPYYIAKSTAEKEAWEIAKELKLDMVSVLPGSITGGEFGRDTPTLHALNAILFGHLKIAFISGLSIVGIHDLVDGIISAAKKGKSGSRYILSNEKPVEINDIFRIANKVNPEIEMPITLPKEELLSLADGIEKDAKEKGEAPMVQKHQIELYFRDKVDYDISKSIADLGFSPRSGEEIIEEYYKKVFSNFS